MQEIDLVWTEKYHNRRPQQTTERLQADQLAYFHWLELTNVLRHFAGKLQNDTRAEKFNVGQNLCTKVGAVQALI